MTGDRMMNPSREEPSEAAQVVAIARACTHRCDHGGGQWLTLDECRAAVEHPLTGLPAPRLKDVIGYLSAQVVGYRHRESGPEAAWALGDIESIISDYRQVTK